RQEVRLDRRPIRRLLAARSPGAGVTPLVDIRVARPKRTLIEKGDQAPRPPHVSAICLTEGSEQHPLLGLDALQIGTEQNEARAGKDHPVAKSQCAPEPNKECAEVAGMAD